MARSLVPQNLLNRLMIGTPGPAKVAAPQFARIGLSELAFNGPVKFLPRLMRSFHPRV